MGVVWFVPECAMEAMDVLRPRMLLLLGLQSASGRTPRLRLYKCQRLRPMSGAQGAGCIRSDQQGVPPLSK